MRNCIALCLIGTLFSFASYADHGTKTPVPEPVRAPADIPTTAAGETCQWKKDTERFITKASTCTPICSGTLICKKSGVVDTETTVVCAAPGERCPGPNTCNDDPAVTSGPEKPWTAPPTPPPAGGVPPR